MFRAGGIVLAAVAALTAASPQGAWGQFTLEDLPDFEEAVPTDTTTAPERPYFGDTEEQLRSVDLGQWVPRDEQGREREVLILVREGERIFCAHCGTLLRSTVQFRHVTMEESVKYFDDGTHGDLIPNDGLPSNVKDINNDYIGPRCYQHMLFLEGLRDRADFRDAHRAIFLRTNPMDYEEPQTFFTQVKVAPLDAESRLAVDPMARINPETPGVEARYTFMALEQDRKQVVREFEEQVINEFKRKPWHTDYYLHPDEINPFIPAPIAMGPLPLSVGPTGPSVSRPRWMMLRDEAAGYTQEPQFY